MGGSSTTTVDNNNPLSKQLGANMAASWDVLGPILMANMKGMPTPTGEQAAGVQENLQKYMAGRYGQHAGTPQMEQGVNQTYENLTKPTMDWNKLAGSIYAGLPGGSAAGASNTQNQPGVADYASLAASIALLAGK